MILGLLGVVLQDLDVILGLNCDPITGVGVGSGNACSSVTVCCENNAVVSTLPRAGEDETDGVHLQGGIISIGCIPVFL